MLIQDKENPTGMFSKAGRLSIEMFALLQEKESIMTNKKKVFYIKQPFEEKKVSAKQFDPTAQAKIASPNDTKKNFKPVNAMSKQEQPFAKTLSRQHLDDLSDKVRVNNQKFGMYNPKYHFIYEKSAFYQDEDFLDQQKQNYSKLRIQSSKEKKGPPKKLNTLQDYCPSPSKSKGHLSTQNLTKMNSVELGQSLSMPTIFNEGESKLLMTKIKGHLHFSRMADRKPFINGPGPHEKRFEFLELPGIYSNVKKPLNVYFKSGQKQANVFTLQQSGLQYDINFDSIYPKAVKMVANFEKVTARSFPMKPVYNNQIIKSYTLDESIVDTSLYKLPEIKSPNQSQILKKIPGPTFTLMLPRDMEPSNNNKMLTSTSQHVSNSYI